MGRGIFLVFSELDPRLILKKNNILTTSTITGFRGYFLHIPVTALFTILHRKSGAVINMSSSAGQLPTPQMTVYAATKVILFFSVKNEDHQRPHSQCEPVLIFMCYQVRKCKSINHQWKDYRKDLNIKASGEVSYLFVISSLTAETKSVHLV